MPNIEKKLAPCPFCGGQANVGKVGRDWYRVECEHELSCPLIDDQLDFCQTCEGLTDLLECWNTRSSIPITEIEKLIEDLKIVEKSHWDEGLAGESMAYGLAVNMLKGLINKGKDNEVDKC